MVVMLTEPLGLWHIVAAPSFFAGGVLLGIVADAPAERVEVRVGGRGPLERRTERLALDGRVDLRSFRKEVPRHRILPHPS